MSIVREGGNQIKGVSMLVRILRPYFRWIAVVCLALLVFGLGYSGFREYSLTVHRERSSADIAYLSLQLFVLQSGDLDGPIGWKLEFARFAAPVVAAYAGFCALLSIFFYHVQLVRPWLIGNHVIVCGLGRRGSKLVQQLRAQGKCVVVIEQDENNPELVYCRQMGAIVLLGAANDRRILDKACVHRARTLISIVGDDGVNVETAVLAHQLNQKRRSGVLDCVVHVFDPRLQRALKKHRIFTDTNDPFELRLFNAFEIAAQAMLQEHPGLASAAADGKHRPHLLIVGLGRLGESLLVQAAAEWRERRTSPADKLHLTVIDRQVELKRDWLPICYPDLAEACDITFVQMDIHFPRFPDRVVLDGSNGVPPVTAAYVCVDSDSLALFAALTLRDCLKGKHVPIVVRMTEKAGLAALISSAADSPGLIDGVHAVGLLDVACSMDLLLR
jgi:voltage-gated potassium channel Kch